MRYASGTNVSEDRSRTEIERMLRQWGASEFAVASSWERNEAMIAFRHKAVRIQMVIRLPDPKDKKFVETGRRGLVRTPESARAVYEAEIRRRWRSLCLALKAKMVAVEDGITTFEKEFLPYMVTSDGRTIGDVLAPAIEQAMVSNGVIALDRQLPKGKP